MLERVKAYIQQYAMIQPGDKVLVGLSGGADSVCLTDILLHLSESMNFTLVAAHMEHGIRGEESKEDMRFVRDFCAARGIPLYVRETDIPKLAAQRRMGLEQTARDERKAFLQSLCTGIGVTKVATAHQANDNAESILLNLTRGATLKGLRGIRPVNGIYIRPLLCAERSEVEAYCRENGLTWRHDSTNDDIEYSRNFIRHKVLPLLTEINPRFVHTLSANAPAMRAADEYLDKQADAIFTEKVTVEKNSVSLPLNATDEEAIFNRICLKMAAALGVEQDIYTPHFEAVHRLVVSGKTGKTAELTHNLRARISYGNLVFSMAENREKPEKIAVTKCGSYPFGAGKLSIRRLTKVPSDVRACGKVRYADADKLFAGELWLRTRADGDIIKPYNGGTKKLKKYFIDRKIDREKRDTIPLLARGNDILCIAGTEVSHHVCVDETTVHAVKITYEEEE